MHFFLLNSIAAYAPLGYFLVFIGMIIEGDAFLFLAVFLLHRGFFQLDFLVLSVFTGALFGDWLWYELGRWLNASNSWVSRWAERIARPLDPQLAKRPFRTILLTKFTYGIHHAVLMRAGASHHPYKRIFWFDFPAVLIWMIVVGGIAYLFSASLVAARHYLRFAEIGLLLGLIVFIGLERWLGALSENRLERES